jgi:membrane fusion protein (multidrug efflux system)
MDVVETTKKPSFSKGRLIAWIIILGITLIGLLYYWHYREYHPSTDDAYVQAHIVHLSPQISGPIAKLYAENHAIVAENQKLLDIDASPFQIAVNAARAELDLAQQKVTAMEDAVKNAQALIDERNSELNIALKNAARLLPLVKSGQAPRSTGDDVENRIQVARAALASAESQLAEAQANLGQLGKDNAQVRAATEKLNQTLLDLEHTHIIAPSDGKIVNFTARTGTMVQAGVPLLDIVSQRAWWVDANFKETQLKHIKPKQSATIILDIYPDYIFTGYVESISAGSGSAFSLLPPENATGNWVKVTQRIPIKIIITNPSPDYPLRVGASATVTIDTTAQPL